MKLKDRFQRSMIRIYLRYISVFFCIVAGTFMIFKRSGKKVEKKLLNTET